MTREGLKSDRGEDRVHHKEKLGSRGRRRDSSALEQHLAAEQVDVVEHRARDVRSRLGGEDAREQQRDDRVEAGI